MSDMTLGEASLEQTGHAAPLRDRSVFQLHWILIALMPVIMAAATWGPQHYHYAIQVWLRFFSWPVLIVEVIVIGIAMAKGIRPLAILRMLPAPAQGALAVVVTIGLGTTMFVAPDPASAALRTNTTLIHICFGFAVAGLVGHTSPRFDRDIWPLIVAGLLAYLAMLVVFVATIRDPRNFEWLHFGLAVSNIRFVGFFAIVGAGAALALACLSDRPATYWGWVAAGTLFTSLMFWSGSRNPVLALMGTCLIAAWLVPSIPGLKIAIAWLFSMIGGAVISFIYIPPHWAYGVYRMIFSLELGSPTAIASGRPDLWRRSLEAVVERPLFGFGEGQYMLVVPQETGFHPHNLIFQFLVQWGVIGAASALGLLAVAWWQALHMTRQSAGQLLPGFLVLTALLLASLFDGVFFFVYPSMLVALTIGLVLGVSVRARLAAA